MKVEIAKLDATGITVTAQPEKVVYFTGESFDAKGMTVTLTRKDATSVELPAEDYTIEPSTFEKEGKQNVTVTYTAKPEHTATVAVKVINKKAVSTVISQRTKPALRSSKSAVRSAISKVSRSWNPSVSSSTMSDMKMRS